MKLIEIFIKIHKDKNFNQIKNLKNKKNSTYYICWIFKKFVNFLIGISFF